MSATGSCKYGAECGLVIDCECDCCLTVHPCECGDEWDEDRDAVDLPRYEAATPAPPKATKETTT